MTILALDLGLSVGWAVSTGPSGTKAFKTHEGDWGITLDRFDEWLKVTIAEHKAIILAWEMPWFGNTGSAAPVLHWMEGVCILRATRSSCIRRTKPPASIKKHATGNGRAKRPEMLAAAQARWPEVATDHEAVAKFLAEMVA